MSIWDESYFDHSETIVVETRFGRIQIASAEISCPGDPGFRAITVRDMQRTDRAGRYDLITIRPRHVCIEAVKDAYVLRGYYKRCALPVHEDALFNKAISCRAFAGLIKSAAARFGSKNDFKKWMKGDAFLSDLIEQAWQILPDGMLRVFLVKGKKSPFFSARARQLLATRYPADDPILWTAASRHEALAGAKP